MSTRIRTFAPLFSWIGDLAATRRQRNALTALEDRQLADIGVSRSDALAEAQRPLWDVPAFWRQKSTKCGEFSSPCA